VFALDVGDPDGFNPAADVLWEFTSDDDPDMGHTFGDPIISRLEDGTWVAVFANGYNSDSEQAFLYVVDLFDGPDTNGDPLFKIPLGAPGDNGLSGVAGFLDPESRNHLSRVYAGDLNGTIWRVDFISSSPDVKYDDGLFSDPAGNAITATPSLAAHPEGGLMVYVGTGKLVEVADRTDTSQRTFWAIRDQDSPVNSLSDLGRVEVSEGPSDPGVLPQLEVEAVNGFRPGGWYMPLSIDGDVKGERVLSKPLVSLGRVILATFEAADDNCIPGGIQRLYVVDALTGDGSLSLTGSTCAGNCGGVVLGAGAPIAPPLLIKRPPPPDTDVVVDFPGHSDPDNPSDPPTPPGTATGDPASWCSQFGVPLATTSGTVEFTPLGSICEGRQVWRQIR
jgi:type IV pilus assembly protein PilY1